MESDCRVIEGRARDIIIRVNKYFEKERDDCKDSLQALNAILKDQAKRVPRTLLSALYSHLRNTKRVSARVTAATNVNKNTLTKILREGAQATINKTKLQTPVKRPRGKKEFFDSAGLEKLKNIIQAQNTGIAFNKLLAIVRQDLNYMGSQSTLRRIIYNMQCHIQRSGGVGGCLAPPQHKALGNDTADSNYVIVDVNNLKNKQDINTAPDNDGSNEEMHEEYLELDEIYADESGNDDYLQDDATHLNR